MSHTIPYLEKEISWLSFNERVLQEALDPTVPVIERVKFLGIFSSNLDEFFKVRVAEVRRAILLDSFRDESIDVHTVDSRKLMKEIQKIALSLQEQFDKAYADLMIELARKNIFLINETQLSESHSAWLKIHFQNHLKRHIAPLIISKKNSIVEYINDDTTYLVVCLHNKEKDTKKYTMLEVPTKNVDRFVVLPNENNKIKKHLILLDNVMRYCIDDVFKRFFEYDTSEVYSMKLTRDADFDITDELDQTQLEKMSKGIRKRLTAEPVRLVYDRDMPDHMLDVLKGIFKISNTECIIPGGRYHSFKDFIGFPNPGRQFLVNKKINALDSSQFAHYPNSFDAIAASDIILNYPYHKFSHFSELIRQASFDPAVKSIKITLYRVASKSHIMQSLMDAVKNGKKVTAIIELQARFDEQANIEWTKTLADAGIKVHHGIPNLKIHSKLCLIGRKEGSQTVNYCHIGSGNFNEKTARIYTDLSLFTANPDITKEVKHVFDLIERPYNKDDFNNLIVSPYDARRKLLTLIDDEIKAAKAQKPSGIILKLNNLVDYELISKLYDASKAGVRIKLIIRGMCSLVPNDPKFSANIEVISIIDRFLEHSRIMLFTAQGHEKIFICSADWMSRNIDSRIEVSTPIYDPNIKKLIKTILEIQLADNIKARIIDQKQSNNYKKRGNKRKIRSQLAIYNYLVEYEKNMADKLKKVNDS